MMAIFKLIPADTQRRLNATDPRWKLKAILSLLTLLTSIISISVFASAIPQWDANFFHNTGPLRGDWTDGFPIGPLASAFLAATIATSYSFVKRRPVSPKLTMIYTALTLLSLASALILAGHGSLFKHWRSPAMRSQSGLLKCNLLNIFTRDCEPILYQVGELQIVGIIFGSLTWILVFITFLVSLYDHRASQPGYAPRGKGRGLRRLTLMVGKHIGNRDVENGQAWHGRSGKHSHSSSDGSRSSQKSRQHRRGESKDHRQSGTRKYYRASIKAKAGDVVPFVLMTEPEMAHPGTRFVA